MRIAASILNATRSGASLVDLGCGSGLLFTGINRELFKNLIGLDISDVAIRNARLRFDDPKMSFSRADVGSGSLPQGDIYVALGLLDWLDNREIANLFRQLGGRQFLISFSEKRQLPVRLAHFMFRKLSALGSDAKVLPRYYSSEDMAGLLISAGLKASLVRGKGMAFGSFVTNLPVDVAGLRGVSGLRAMPLS